MEIALVANAASGSGTDVGRIERALASRGARVRTLAVQDLPERVDADRVVVAGGDGSVGRAALLAARSQVPLGVVPTGTANDFARHLELPLDPEAAAAIASDPGAVRRRMDLAWAGDVPFVNAASAGLSVQAAEAAAPLKPIGPLAYPAGAIKAAATGSPLRCVVRCDGEECFSGDAWQITVAGTGAFGGGAEIDAADPQDGRLDVAILEAGSKLRLARHAAGMLRGNLAELDGVRHLRGREITVEGPDTWNVDGEECSLAPSTFRVEPGALDVLVG
jgi:diacylglycerol kinase (ATP)